MFSFRMQKDPFVLFKEAYCKKKTVQLAALVGAESATIHV